MKKLYHLVIAFIIFINTSIFAQTPCTSITNFPFKETFEDNSPNRPCWTQQLIGGYVGYDAWVFKKGSAGGIDYNIVNAHSGELNARMQYSGYYMDATLRLISPKMDITSLETPTLSFFYGQEAWGLKQNLLNVYYRTSENSEWKLLKNYFSNVPNWKQDILTIPEKSTELQLCFEGIVKFGKANVLDDIVVGNSDSVEVDPTGCAPSTPSNNFESGSGDLKLLYMANDFNVAANTDLTLSKVILNTIDKGGIESFDLVFYKSNSLGLPGEVLKSYEQSIPASVEDLNVRDGFTQRKVTIDLPEVLLLKGASTGARFWLAVKAVNKDPQYPCYQETTSIRNSGQPLYYSVDGVNWTVISNGFDGVFTLIGSCQDTNPTDDYCIPKFSYILPIENVKIGTIDNTSDEEVPYQDFSTIKTDVKRGETYPLQIIAETFNDTSSQAITVFIDWNQNGNLNEVGEIYNIGKMTVANENTITYQLPVPLGAKLGNVKMRIISELYDYVLNSCSVFTQGQAEDYTLVVQKEDLSVSESVKGNKAIVYPNPSQHTIMIKNNSKLTKAEIFDLNGRKLMEVSTENINISKLSSGSYILKMSFEDGKKDSQKIIKK
jgi:hypothetical protein